MATDTRDATRRTDERKAVGTYWIYKANAAMGEFNRVDVVAALLGDTEPAVVEDRHGVRIRHADGRFYFYPWPAVSLVVYEPAKEPAA